jgi:hypothetical protein
VRVFFAINIYLWFVLFVAWVTYNGLIGIGNRASTQVALILAITAVLLTIQGFLRYRRFRKRRLT